MPHTHTESFANLVISDAAFTEIEGLLRAAGYSHLFVDGVIRMQGLALKQTDEPAPAIANDLVAALVKRWRKDANQYAAQAQEALRSGTPHEQQTSAATFLRLCAKELEVVQTKLEQVKPPKQRQYTVHLEVDDTDLDGTEIPDKNHQMVLINAVNVDFAAPCQITADGVGICLPGTVTGVEGADLP